MLDILLGVLSLALAAGILGYYVRRVRSVLREERQAGEIVKDIVHELRSRMVKQERGMTEQGVKLEVVELRLSKLELTQLKSGGDLLATSKPIATQALSMELRRLRPRDVPASVSGKGPTPLGPTELRVLDMLREGRMTPGQIQERLGRSREHTARLLKALHEKGYVEREEEKKPYTYALADKEGG